MVCFLPVGFKGNLSLLDILDLATELKQMGDLSHLGQDHRLLLGMNLESRKEGARKPNGLWL